MGVRKWAWLVLAATVLGCSSSSDLIIENKTARSIQVTVVEGETTSPAWRGLIEAGDEQPVWSGFGGTNKLRIEVDGHVFRYPPLPNPLANAGSGGGVARWSWDGSAPEFRGERSSKVTQLVTRLMLLGGAALLLFIVLPVWLIQRCWHGHS